MSGIVKKAVIAVVAVFILSSSAFAQLYLNVLAVNGTEEAKEKQIKQYLPPELAAEDILDTAGLELDYDVNKEAYYVHGAVNLAAKETRTFKVLIRDIWQFEEEEISELREQIDKGLERVQGTEYEETGEVRHQNLTRRLEYILTQQEEAAGDIPRRIDQYRAYEGEFEQIRKNAIDVTYWRTKAPSAEEQGVINYVIEVQNNSEEIKKTVDQKHYLPSEVKPEHLVNAEDFEYRYDPELGQPYLYKEEELQPGQSKRYVVGVIDIWQIPDTELANLRQRTNAAFQYLQNTKYEDTAKYLVANIKKNIEAVEASQTQELGIKEHISAYRTNNKRFQEAQKDVDALEDLLKAVREELERSKLRNVLERLRELSSLQAIAEAIFGTKPTLNNVWRIIIGVCIFVGVLVIVHFIIWGRRSKDVKIEKEAETAGGEETEEGGGEEEKKES